MLAQHCEVLSHLTAGTFEPLPKLILTTAAILGVFGVPSA